ncbi:MAG TPA: hypothetical protein VGX03_38105 [Candidatus Binatia bacterium]|jgi:hypothetical protein|nr:hypothetical protein [Candidatus Binatia bacterium]
MMANLLPEGRERPTFISRRAELVSTSKLQQHYATATASLGEHFPTIDAWLAEHLPDLWRQIRQEDDELFRLCQLGIPERTFQDKLDALLALCEQAEQLYCEAHPEKLRLPPLAEGERVAIYYELADGSLHKVSNEEE